MLSPRRIIPDGSSQQRGRATAVTGLLGTAAVVLVVFASGASAGTDNAAQASAQEKGQTMPAPSSQPGSAQHRAEQPNLPRFRPGLSEQTLEPAGRPTRVAERSDRERTTAERGASGRGAPQVAVYGDRLGQALASGLADARSGAITVAKNTAEDAGLARPDFEAWLRSVRESLARSDRPSVAVMLVGSNDRRPLQDGQNTADPTTARWQALYEGRIDAVAAMFRDAGVALIWVGLPAVRSDQASAEFVRLNGIFRDRAAKDGVTYVDSWEAFTDDAGRYSPMGPDIDGQTAKLRKADGFGFTRAGALKLASFVTGSVNRLGAPAGSGEPGAVDVAHLTIEKTRDFDSALAIDVNAQIRREVGLPGAPEASPKSEAPQGPAAGPVIALTAPPSSPGGRLASATSGGSLAAGSMPTTLVFQPPADGRPVPPRPGRTDDFSWPKPQ